MEKSSKFYVQGSTFKVLR